mmetsp:Transcript_109293/g.319957  ORF Transcript_109293/g.319957 Transcript_109293/m.319957 type:complete len:289 (-) Transcript_109293:8-874(-)
MFSHVPQVPRLLPVGGSSSGLHLSQHSTPKPSWTCVHRQGASPRPDHDTSHSAWTACAAAAAAAVGVMVAKVGPTRSQRLRTPRSKAASVVALAAEDAASSNPPEDAKAQAETAAKKPDGAAMLNTAEAGLKGSEDVAAASDASEDLVPAAAMGAKASVAGRVALVAQRLVTAEKSLRRWGYVAEVVYTWLGLISLGIASFAAFSHGSMQAYRSPAMALGPFSVGLSLLCSLVGWFQARGCRSIGRRCGLAASSLEPGGPPPPAAQFHTVMPALGDIEGGLRARQRTT